MTTDATHNLEDQLRGALAALASAIGIVAADKDVDSLAKGGGAFSYDPDTTTGLTFGYKLGRVVFAGSVVEVAAGTIALTASNVNYVEVDSAGTVSKNVSGWTAGKVRLWKITTGSAAISLVENAKTLLGLVHPAGVTGTLLSTAAATKETVVRVGTLSATDATITIPLPNHAGTISRISVEVTTTVAANDTDYWTFGVINKAAGGAGAVVVVDGTAAANSTKVTGGSALTNFSQRDLTLTSTPADLVHAAKDTLLLTATKAASGANLVALTVRVETTFTA